MSADLDFNCWRCGQRHEKIPAPLPRNEQCTACGADLHVCRQCKYYAPNLANACAEPVAEAVGEKKRANFCGYFSAASDLEPSTASGGNETELKALFGMHEKADGGLSPSNEDAARSALDDLFGLEGKDD